MKAKENANHTCCVCHSMPESVAPMPPTSTPPTVVAPTSPILTPLTPTPPTVAAPTSPISTLLTPTPPTVAAPTSPILTPPPYQLAGHKRPRRESSTVAAPTSPILTPLTPTPPTADAPTSPILTPVPCQLACQKRPRHGHNAVYTRGALCREIDGTNSCYVFRHGSYPVPWRAGGKRFDIDKVRALLQEPYPKDRVTNLYIQTIPILQGEGYIICDEEGMRNNPNNPNLLASAIMGGDVHGGFLYGTVLVCGKSYLEDE